MPFQLRRRSGSYTPQRTDPPTNVWLFIVEGLAVVLLLGAVIGLIFVQFGVALPVRLPDIQFARQEARPAATAPVQPYASPTPVPLMQVVRVQDIRTLADAQRKVGFKIRQPGYLPDGMRVTAIQVKEGWERDKFIVSLLLAVPAATASSPLPLTFEQSNAQLPLPAASTLKEPFRVDGQDGQIVVDADGTVYAFWERDGFFFSLHPAAKGAAPAGGRNSMLEEMRKIIESMP